VANFQVEESGGAETRFDAHFDIQYGDSKVRVYVEAKNTCTPKQVEQIAPWLSRLKATQKGAAFALVCPALSPQSQTLCLQRNVDFIDLAGNVFISVPGKLLLQRVGMQPQKETSPSFYRNPFSGKSSRILRVLLQGTMRPWISSDPRPVEMLDINRPMVQKPKAWTLSDIIEELAAETRRVQCPGISFEVSFSLASRVLRSLEEELLVIRRPTSFDPGQAVSERDIERGRYAGRVNPISVPEPRRLLTAWAQEYKDRYRGYLRRSFKVPNPFGTNLQSVQQDLDRLLKPKCYAFTGAAAASLTAPFVDVDPIDLFISDGAGADNLRTSISGVSVGPDLRVIYAYDPGVFMYSSRKSEIPVVSDIQAYLDLFARGGRDLKQAEYLLQQRIEPMWGSK
jgi:hypothetical protein